MRVGAAQDLLALNMELPSGMQAGRWADTRMPMRYGEKILAGRGGDPERQSAFRGSYGENVLFSRLRHIPRSPSCSERVMRDEATRPDSATRRSGAKIAAI